MSGGWSQSGGMCFAQDFGGLTGTNAAPSATANTKGSWISMGTLTGGCSSFLFRIAYVNAGQADYGCSVDIGVGPSGSQLALVNNINLTLQPAGLGQGTIWQHAFPVSIAPGTQVWVRSALNVASFSGSILCWFTPYDTSFVALGECSGVETLGATVTGRGTAIVAGATQSGTKGSYVQLGTATRDYVGFLLNQDLAHNGTNESGNMIDISIGASGSQVVILPDIEIYQGGVEAPSDFEFVAIPIPAGSAVWGRSASIAPDVNFGLTLYGVF